MDAIDSGLPGGHAPNHWYDTWDRQSSQSFSSTTKGLRNAPGENNCFLNSAVQVFWHIDVFRRSYRRLSGHLCMGHSCIFCALKVIFTQFQYSDQASLQPSALRKALANTFAKQERFQLGHMDDAAECFENILNRIHYHIANSHNEDKCTAPHCIPHQKFAMTVFDQLVCPCGATSEPLKFHEMVHYISANALVSQSRTMQESGDMLHPSRFGLLLRSAGAVGDVRDCPSNCGKRVQKRRTLLNVPDVVSIGLVWGSDKPDEEITTEVARCVGTTLLLPDIFHSVMCNDASSLPRLQLTAIVCYYGKHYSSFIWHTKLQEWIYFDDATVIQIGTRWENVVDKIARNRYQPLLLIYTNHNATPVPTDTAPSTRVMAPGYSMTPVKTPVEKPVEKPSSTSKKSLNTSMDSQQSVSSAATDASSAKTDKEKEALGRQSSFEHRRQSSFLIAVTKQKAKDESIYAVPHNNKQVVDAQKDISRSDLRAQLAKQGLGLGLIRDVEEVGENGENYYTLSNMDAYRRPGLNSPDANNLPLTQGFTRAAETQRKESFKKGKGKIGADVIRYHVDPNRPPSLSSDSDQGSPVNGEAKEIKGVSGNGKPALPAKPAHVRTRSQSLEDNTLGMADPNGPNNHHQHKIIKPTPSSASMYDTTDSVTRAHTPVQSGLATLPRSKKSNVSSSSQHSSSSSLQSQSGSQYNSAAHSYPHDSTQTSFSQQQPASLTGYQQQQVGETTQGAVHNVNGYQSCLTYQNVVDMDMHSRQSSTSSILSQGTVIECEPETSGAHNRQSSTVSVDTLTDKKPKSKRKDKDEKKKEDRVRKEEKKQKNKKERISQSGKPPPIPDKKSPRERDEGFIDESREGYIDRRMVESVLSLQKLQRSSSCVSQASNSSVESDGFHNRAGVNNKLVTPKDNLSSEIPFDAASLDSHKDSGYGSSDRNSSSSTGSITMNPYEQYFLSRSMIPPKTFNPHVLHENMKKLMDQGGGMRGLEYTQEKDLKSLVTNPNEFYNQTNNYTVGFLDGPNQPNQGIGPNMNPNLNPNVNPNVNPKPGAGPADLTTMTREDRNQYLQEALTGKMKPVAPPQVPTGKPGQPGLQQQGPPGVNQQRAQQGVAPGTLQEGPGAQPGSNMAKVNGPSYPDGVGPQGAPPSGVPGPPSGVHTDQQEVLSSGQEQFLLLCQHAEELMDACVLAETSEKFGDAARNCQNAIDLLGHAMRLPLGQTSHTYATRKSNSCLLKLRSLQKRLAPARQESNSPTNSTESGVDHSRVSRGNPPQHKTLQHLQQQPAGGPGGSGLRPTSRSGSQTSVDSLKDASSSSGRSSTPVFDKRPRPSTDERVPPIDGHIPAHEYHNGYNKDRSFETNVPDTATVNNADLFGTLPRRKTQKSADHVRGNNQKHEAEVYKDFLDSQRRNSGNHSRQGSGARTPVNEPLPGNKDIYNYHMSQSQAADYTSAAGRQGMQQQHYTHTAQSFALGGSGLVPIPVAPPKIENQSQHTEVGNQSHFQAISMMPDLQRSSAKPDNTVHGHHGNSDSSNHHGNSNSQATNSVSSESGHIQGKPGCSPPGLESNVRRDEVVSANRVYAPNSRVYAPSASIRTAYSTPLQLANSAYCQSVEVSPCRTNFAVTSTADLDPLTSTTGPVLTPAASMGTSTARFKCGGPNRYRSSTVRRLIDRSASFSHPTRPNSTLPSNPHSKPTDDFEVAGKLGSSRINGSSQPDLRQLSREQVSRPLTPQLLSSESSSTDQTQAVSVRDLKSRFESVGISSEQQRPSVTASEQVVNSSHNPINVPQNTTPSQEQRKGPRALQRNGPFHRQRSKSESESKLQQPPRPKSALSKKSRFADTNNKPRKSVTFSANICKVANIDKWDQRSRNDHVTQAGYQSDEEGRGPVGMRFPLRTMGPGPEDDDTSSSTSDSPVEVSGEGSCALCHKLGVEAGQSYCAKCTYYMSRFTPR